MTLVVANTSSPGIFAAFDLPDDPRISGRGFIVASIKAFYSGECAILIEQVKRPLGFCRKCCRKLGEIPTQERCCKNVAAPRFMTSH